MLWNSAKVKSAQKPCSRPLKKKTKGLPVSLHGRLSQIRLDRKKRPPIRMETEARISKIKEIEERVSLVEELRRQ